MQNKVKYNYCDIITHAGNRKFLAKVKTSMQKDGTATFGPSEVLVEGVWRPIKEFAVHWTNYSCNDYRQTEQVQLSVVAEPITTTFTPQEPYGKRPKPASSEFDAAMFGLYVSTHRECLFLSRRKAAEQIGIPESAVAAIEAGSYHGIDEVAKTAKWLELSASEMGGLFGLKDQEQPKKSWIGTTAILVLLFIIAWIILWNL